MIIVVDFDCKNKKAEVVKVVEEKIDDMPLYDVMPYIHDALYKYLKQENKKNMLR